MLHAGGGPSAGPHRQGISVPKILVADDNTNIQKMVSLALEERGIHVVSVGNGEAAVRRIPDVNPDLVLADIFMPVRNGYEVCEFVKKDERFAHVPVILLVGAFDPLDEKEARRVGADGVLKKPFVPPDPLIAMVTSALEKNPRVAAELAKAKEAKMAPAPEPVPNIDLSARPAPKPLPNFPEPSPEEAAVVYGFGKGVRPQEANDSDDDVDITKGPVAVPGSYASEDEDDEARSTSSDWRRSAMDLEIPAELAGQPAMASMGDLEPISFPSEKDYPPRRVAPAEKAEETPAAVNSAPPSGPSEFSLRQVDEPETATEPELAHTSNEIPEPPQFQPEAMPATSVGLHPVDIEAAPEPNATSAGGHWLDAVSSAQINHPQGGWMDKLQPSTAQENASNAPATEISTGLSEPASAAGAGDTDAKIADSYSPNDEQQSLETDEGQSFFADESENQAGAEAEHQAAIESFAGSSKATEFELDSDGAEPPLALKDPALVEPPAVHVTPEPLLIEEDASGPSQYGAESEATSPLHSFITPVEGFPPADSAEAPPAAATEFPLQAGLEVAEPPVEEVNERIPTMAPPNREALAHIPFLTPPPSFLAEMNAPEPQKDAPRAADAETVNTVVQKVLDKLQPQLQELLSQGLLKPLVENLLQDELTKKR
jgi:CheY-like chemotaxis protein